MFKPQQGFDEEFLELVTDFLYEETTVTDFLQDKINLTAQDRREVVQILAEVL